MRLRSAVFLMLAVLASSAGAQVREPIGRFVADVRGLMAGLPTSAGWTPALPSDTPVPSRGFGLDVAGHVRLGRWGPATLGAGASMGVAQGRSTPLVSTLPRVTTRQATVAPQASFNFGHRLGWSYVSLGYGATRITSESEALADVPAARLESGWTGTINVGGGARWFITEHVGVGFDARWHRVSGHDATATTPAAPRTTLFNLAVGFTVQ
jgi:hypothetical protein